MEVLGRITQSSKITQILAFLNAMSLRALGSVVAALKRPMTVGLVLGISSLVLTGCGESYSWHQKITVKVETPTGVIISASVVYKETTKTGNALIPKLMRTFVSRMEGEAVVVDLDNGKYLFVLLRENNGLALKVFASEVGWAGRPPHTPWPGWAEKLTRLRGKREIAGDLVPMMVTFGDVDNPLSVKEVSPKNLAATFGPGYSLKSVEFEITDEAVTKGKVGRILTWLNALDGGYLHGGSTSKGSPLGLYGNDFLLKQ